MLPARFWLPKKTDEPVLNEPVMSARSEPFFTSPSSPEVYQNLRVGTPQAVLYSADRPSSQPLRSRAL